VVRVGVGELLELDEAELLQCDLLALSFGDAPHLQAEGDVAKGCAPGEELGEVLEDDAAVHALPGDLLAAYADLAGGGLAWA
jgi:hypothetical protein